MKGVYIKDESKRFGLNAFKALGASYAIHKLFPDGNVGLTVTATDGNHGKGMAWSTHRLGGHAVVFMPPERWTAAWKPSAPIGDTEVTVTDLNYDGTVATAAAYAKEHGGHLVQDTAFEGYEEVPQNITLGYSTMAAEALEELAALGAGEPTHTFLQAGVGSMAGGVAGLPGGDLQKSPRHGRGGGLGVRLRAGIHPPGQAGHHRRPHPDLHGRSQLRHP